MLLVGHMAAFRVMSLKVPCHVDVLTAVRVVLGYGQKTRNNNWQLVADADQTLSLISAGDTI